MSGRENEKIVKTDGILEYLNDDFFNIEPRAGNNTLRKTWPIALSGNGVTYFDRGTDL